MRKLSALLLTFILLLSLAACGGSGSGTPSSGTDTPGTGESTVPGQSSTQTADIENKVGLSLDADHYEQNGTISVTLNFNKLNQAQAVIVIVSADTAHNTSVPTYDTAEELRYLSDFSELPFYLFAPIDKDGLFDVRVYANDTDGEELASVTIAVGSARLPDADETQGTPDGGNSTILSESGNATQKQMEDTIVSYFASVSSLTSLTLCGGSSIEFEPADIPWQSVAIWSINNPTVSYAQLAALMSSQLTSAGFTEEEMSIGGYKWSVAVGDKTMRIELRPEEWADAAYMIYATPEAE